MGMMTEIDGDVYWMKRMNIDMGFGKPNGGLSGLLVSAIDKKPVEVMQTQSIKGDLGYNPDLGYFIDAENQQIPILEPRFTLTDVNKRTQLIFEEEQHERLMKKYSGTEVSWFGIIAENLKDKIVFHPYLVSVQKTENLEDTKFYYCDIAKNVERVTDTKFGFDKIKTE